MLADELLVGPTLMEYDQHRVKAIVERVTAAQKYVVAPDCAAVAEVLSDDMSGLVRAFPFCRLPYPNIWIEFAHADRPKHFAAPIHAPKMQVLPSRIGFLCTATRDDLSAWRAHQFWKIRPEQARHGPPGCNGAAMAIDYDMTANFTNVTSLPSDEEAQEHYKKTFRKDLFTAIEASQGWIKAAESVRLAMVNHTHPTVPDYGLPLTAGYSLTAAQKIESLNLIYQLARSDWSGEATYLLALIGLLNTRNAIEAESSDLSRLNRARNRRGQRPLFEHKLLKISNRKITHVASGEGDSRAAMRRHWCSGHWKVRKTGIYFWRPHLRGRGQGFVSKDYELT